MQSPTPSLSPPASVRSNSPDAPPQNQNSGKTTKEVVPSQHPDDPNPEKTMEEVGPLLHPDDPNPEEATEITLEE